MRTKPFLFFAVWWPICTAVLFGSFFLTGERKPLGDSAPVWFTGRAIILVLSILALIKLRDPEYRAYLGHAILGFGGAVTVAYYRSTPVHDEIFWGETLRQAMFVLLLYALTVCSFTVLDREKTRRIVEAPDEELEKVI